MPWRWNLGLALLAWPLGVPGVDSQPSTEQEDILVDPKPFLSQLDPDHDFCWPALYPWYLLRATKTWSPGSPQPSPQEPTFGLLGSQPHPKDPEKSDSGWTQWLQMTSSDSKTTE